MEADGNNKLSSVWQKHGWTHMDFSDESRLDAHLELLSGLRSVFKARRFWKRPAVFISADDEQADHLFVIVESHGGEVVDNKHEATHVRLPPQPLRPLLH